MPVITSEHGSVALTIRSVGQVAAISSSGGRTAVTVVAKAGSGTPDAKRGATITVQQKGAAIAAGVQAVGLVRQQLYLGPSASEPLAVPGLPLLFFETGLTGDPDDVVPSVIL